MQDSLLYIYKMEMIFSGSYVCVYMHSPFENDYQKRVRGCDFVIYFLLILLSFSNLTILDQLAHLGKCQLLNVR